MKKGCRCVRNEDGECESCRAQVLGCIKRFSEAVERFKQEIRDLPEMFESGCKFCGAKYVDMAIAGIVSSTPYRTPEDVLDAVGQMTKIARASGTMMLPLTEHAMSRVFKANGWAMIRRKRTK